MDKLNQFLFAILMTPVTAITRGLVLVKLWYWFVVPQFHTGTLSVPVALGIATLVGLLTMRLPKQGDKPCNVYINVLSTLLSSGLSLFFGWVYHLFM